MKRVRCNLKLSFEDIRNAMIDKQIDFPKYVSPLINLANQFAQATRPKVVGQVSELIRICPHRDFEGWKKWYLERYPNAIDDATEKIMDMLVKFKSALDKIDRETVRRWVEDLVIVKTYLGLRVQEPILKFISSNLGMTYRLSTPEEESKGVDGFVGDYSISVKPLTYKEKGKLVKETIKSDVIVFYEKDKQNNISIRELESLTDKGDEFLDILMEKLF